MSKLMRDVMNFHDDDIDRVRSFFIRFDTKQKIKTFRSFASFSKNLNCLSLLMQLGD